MILQMIKKQALIFLRNPVQILLLFGLPVILITILGSALGNLMDGGEIDLTFPLAIVEHEDERAQVEQFLTDLDSSGLPEQVIQEIRLAAESITPVETFMELLQSEQLQEMIILEELEPNRLSELTGDDSYAAVIEFPEDFTYQMLNKLLLEEDTRPEVIIHHNEGAELAGNIVSQLLKTYQEEYTLSSFLGKNGINPEQLYSMSSDFEQEVTSISKLNPVDSKTYYTIGMVVMNVLFMGAAIAGYAFEEKKDHIFDRMIIADLSRWTYFISTLILGMLFAFIQSLFVFAFSYFVFDVTWPDIGAFLTITLFFAIAVGGLSVLLTAISYRVNSEQIINLFSGVVVTILAFVGGSFFPVGDNVKFMQVLGDLTPNGATMSAYLSILRGETIAENIDHLLYIVCFALTAIIIGVLSFPKRGASS